MVVLTGCLQLAVIVHLHAPFFYCNVTFLKIYFEYFCHLQYSYNYTLTFFWTCVFVFAVLSESTTPYKHEYVCSFMGVSKSMVLLSKCGSVVVYWRFVAIYSARISTALLFFFPAVFILHDTGGCLRRLIQKEVCGLFFWMYVYGERVSCLFFDVGGALLLTDNKT